MVKHSFYHRAQTGVGCNSDRNEAALRTHRETVWREYKEDISLHCFGAAQPY